MRTSSQPHRTSAHESLYIRDSLHIDFRYWSVMAIYRALENLPLRVDLLLFPTNIQREEAFNRLPKCVSKICLRSPADAEEMLHQLEREQFTYGHVVVCAWQLLLSSTFNDLVDALVERRYLGQVIWDECHAAAQVGY